MNIHLTCNEGDQQAPVPCELCIVTIINHVTTAADLLDKGKFKLHKTLVKD